MPDGQAQPQALSARSQRSGRIERSARSAALAVSAGLVVVLVSLGLRLALSNQERAYILDSATNIASSRQKLILLELDDYMHDLQRAAALWETAGSMTPAFEQNMRLYQQQYPSLKDMAWIDGDGIVRWELATRPPDQWRLALSDTAVLRTLHAARLQKQLLISPVLGTLQGSMMVVPLFFTTRFDGFLVGVLDTQRMLTALLQSFGTRSQSRVSEGGQTLYQSSAGPVDAEWSRQSGVDVAGLHWNIEAWPGTQQLSDGRTHLPEVVLVAGLSLAIMLALTIYSRSESTHHASQLGAINESLGREIQERRSLDAALQQARHDAEAASHAKGRFLASMSHEIRTPMNAILGWTELALEGTLGAEQRTWLEMVEDAGQSLLEILDDCLDVSKIEAGQLELERAPFALRSVVRRSVALMTIRASQRNLELFYRVPSDVPDALLGDQARFRQILLNLVSNAIKFTETGGVSIDIHAADVGERSVGLQIAVRDTGIGIAADRLDAIFRPFTQGDDATTRRFGGTGLGLTICRQLAEKMQGRLWVESAPGAGSTFFCALRFDIQPDSHAIFGDVSEKLGVSGVPQSPAGLPELLRPVSNLGPALAADEPAAERSGAGPRVLLAEDNAINQRLAQEILRQHGFEVKVVENGHEAVAAVEKESFDLILMDLEMPELDGLGATKEIRRRELSSGRHIPIVAVTAHAMSGVQQTCQEAGMDGYLTKPFKRAELIELMRGLIPKHRPVVDWDAAMLSVDGSETLLFELCHIFLQDAPPLLAEAAEEVAAASMDAFAHSIHRLGGMMALFVSPQVRDLGRRLEESGKRADPVVVASLWPQFQDVAERLVAELSHRSAPTGPIRA